MHYEEILEKLYLDYYLLSNGFSNVTSSHWRKYGEDVKVIKKKNTYHCSGSNFGNFVGRTIINQIKNLPKMLLTQSLLEKYRCSAKIKQAGWYIAKKQNRIPEFDCIKQMLSTDLLLKHNILEKSRTFGIIGDGYAFLTSLIKMLKPESTVISINLGKILFFDVFYTKKVFPCEKVFLLDELNNNLQEGQIIFLEAEKYHLLYLLPIDLFINIASMQEMDTNVINTYFDIMRSSTGDSYFYCCNRIEKRLPDGSIIRFFDYPWDEKDQIIVDELCPWYQRYPDNFPPFWRNFDGPVYHRLVKIKNRK